jgi:hypothetical protein
MHTSCRASPKTGLGSHLSTRIRARAEGPHSLIWEPRATTVLRHNICYTPHSNLKMFSMTFWKCSVLPQSGALVRDAPTMLRNGWQGYEFPRALVPPCVCLQRHALTL